MRRVSEPYRVLAFDFKHYMPLRFQRSDREKKIPGCGILAVLSERDVATLTTLSEPDQNIIDQSLLAELSNQPRRRGGI